MKELIKGKNEQNNIVNNVAVIAASCVSRLMPKKERAIFKEAILANWKDVKETIVSIAQAPDIDYDEILEEMDEES